MKTKNRAGAIVAAVLAVAVIFILPAFGRQSPQPGDPPRVKEAARATFEFPGGVPIDFIAAVERKFDVDWQSIVTVPRSLAGTQVPKLRVPDTNPEELLKLYNRLGEQDVALGKWHWEGSVKKPNFLVLMPASAPEATNAPPDEPTEIKVFVFKYISGSSLSVFAQAVSAAQQTSMEADHIHGRFPVPGQVVIDQRTSSIVASGTRDFITLVEQLARTLDVPDYEPPVKAPSGQANGDHGTVRQ